MYSAQSRPANDQYECGVASPAPDLDAIYRSKNDQVASKKPSIGRRIFRTVTRFSIAVLIGIGATLAWQSHGDEAKETIRTWAPSLGWLLAVSAPKSSAAAATSSELVQEIEPIARDLAVVRRSVEQLAAKQEQTSWYSALIPQGRASGDGCNLVLGTSSSR
jgi:hypothetical protein